MLTGHLSVRKNKRVIVFFRNGIKEIDKFLKKDKGYVYFERLGKIRTRKLRCISIFKGETNG